MKGRKKEGTPSSPLAKSLRSDSTVYQYEHMLYSSIVGCLVSDELLQSNYGKCKHCTTHVVPAIVINSRLERLTWTFSLCELFILSDKYHTEWLTKV